MTVEAFSEVVPLTLDREAFRTWLATREPDEDVYDESNCPIGHWVAAELQQSLDSVCVGHSVVTYRQNHDLYRAMVPEWGRTFIVKVDNVSIEKGNGHQERLSAKEVLGVLDDLDQDE